MKAISPLSNRDWVRRRARRVALAATSRAHLVSWFVELISVADRGLLSEDEAAWGMARLISHQLVMGDDELDDVATLASAFAIPESNPAALPDKRAAFDLLRRLVYGLQRPEDRLTRGP